MSSSGEICPSLLISSENCVKEMNNHQLTNNTYMWLCVYVCVYVCVCACVSIHLTACQKEILSFY